MVSGIGFPSVSGRTRHKTAAVSPVAPKMKNGVVDPRTPAVSAICGARTPPILANRLDVPSVRFLTGCISRYKLKCSTSSKMGSLFEMLKKGHYRWEQLGGVHISLGEDSGNSEFTEDSEYETNCLWYKCDQDAADATYTNEMNIPREHP